MREIPVGLEHRFASIPSIRFAFGDARRPLPLPFAAEPSLDRRQVHGVRVVEVDAPGQACGEADGFCTWRAGVMVNVITADCLPLLFAREDGGGVAAVHAGWRGLLDGVLESAVAMIAQRDDPARWRCLIGPAAGPCCYEVDEPLVRRFESRLPWLAPHLIAPRHRHLDLGAIARARLNAAGIEDVETLDACTICSRDERGEFRYHSYRRRRGEAGPTNQYACIMIDPDDGGSARTG